MYAARLQQLEDNLSNSISANRLLGNKCQGVVLEFDSDIQYLESGMYVSFSPLSDYSISLYYVTRILHICSNFKKQWKDIHCQDSLLFYFEQAR